MKRSKINPVSKKRARENREYLRLKRDYLEANMDCFIPFCSEMATDIHHMRGRVGTLLTDTQYFRSVCRLHHDKIHQNPEWAREQGYMLDRIGTSTPTP